MFRKIVFFFHETLLNSDTGYGKIITALRSRRKTELDR